MAMLLQQPSLYSQELECGLRCQGGILQQASALANSIKQNTSSAGQKIIKDDIKSLKYKQKDLENRIESAKRDTENGLNSILQSKGSTEKHAKSSLLDGEMLGTSDAPKPTQEPAAVRKSEGNRETNKVSTVIESKEVYLFQKSLESSILIS